MVCNWIHQARQEERRSRKPHCGGSAAVSGPGKFALLQDLVPQTNDASQEELDKYVEHLFALTGKRVGRPVMCRTLQRLKLRRKEDPPGGRAGSARVCGRTQGLSPADERDAC
jgi:hypothetical protein